jgi:hypothetical protein
MSVQVLSAFVGFWLMAAPSLLDYGRPMATSDWIVGPLVASFALIAAWEVTRDLRWVNVVLGAWLVLSPFVLGNMTVAASHIVSGILIGSLSLVPGRRKHSFAGGFRSLFRRGQPSGPGSDHSGS